MKTFRLLRADEIECRVSRCTEKGAVLLLYKTARTDADLLDETFGPEMWENDFKLIDGVLYGGIGIKFNNGTEIWKWDAGTESNTEAEKGRASDAFKRAGFKWGLGRELYSAPFIFIPAAKCNIKERNGKYQCFDDFKIGAIAYDNERIVGLTITLKGQRVFEWGESEPDDKPEDKPNTEENKPNTGKVCADCGLEIMMGVKKDGSLWPSDEIKAYSTRRYGRPLCVDCMKRVEYGDQA